MAGRSIDLGTLRIHLKANIDDFIKKLGKAQTEVGKFGSNLDTKLARSMSRGVGSLRKEMGELMNVVKTNSETIKNSMITVANTMNEQSGKMAEAAKRSAGAFRQSSQNTIKHMLSMSSFVGKIVHYLTFTVGVQLVMGIRRGFEQLFNSIVEFEKLVTDAATVAGYLGASFEQIKKHLEDMAITIGKTTVFSAEEAAKAMYSLASAGYDVGNMTAKDLQPILEYATATSTELDFALQSVTKTLKQFGLEFEDATEVVDAFTTVITSTYATSEKLAEGFKYVGSIAGVLKQEVSTVSAALGILYDRGLEGGQAGQRLNMIYTKLLKPTDKAKKNLEAMGITLDEINPRTHDLVDILYVLGAANFSAADAAEMFRARTAGTAVMLVESADEIADLTNKIKLQGGITEKVASKQMQSLSNQLKLLSNRAGAAGLAFSESLLPMATFLAETIDKHIIPTFQTFASVLESIVGALRAVRPFIEALIPVILLMGTSLIGMWISGKLVLSFLTKAQIKTLSAATGFVTLKSAMLSTAASSFLMVGTLTALATVFPPLQQALTFIIPALLALNILYRLHASGVGKLTRSYLIHTVAQANSIVANTLEEVSIGFLIKEYILLKAAKLRDMLISKQSLTYKIASTTWNYLHAASVAVLSGILTLLSIRTWGQLVAYAGYIKATIAATASTWAFNIALYANPLIWIVLAIVGATAAILALAWAFGAFGDEQDKQVELTKKENAELDILNQKLVESADAQYKLVTATDELADAEERLDRLREDGLETSDEYIQATDEFSRAFNEYNKALRESTDATQNFLDQGQKLIDIFRAEDKQLDIAITKSFDIMTATKERADIDEKANKAAIDSDEALRKYADAVITYGKDSDEAGEARDKLAEIENQYFELLKEGTKIESDITELEVDRSTAVKTLNYNNLARLDIAERVMKAEQQYLDLQSMRTKLLVQEAILTRSVAKGAKLYEEEIKKVWEMQLKVLEAEMALYRLRHEQPEILDDIFSKLSEYGMLNQEIIDLYVAMEEAEAHMFESRMDYWNAVSGLRSDEILEIGELIDEYQKLRSEGLDPIAAWAQAMANTGIDLANYGLGASDVQAIWDYAEAEWAAADAAEAFKDALMPLYDALGSLDMGDLPSDLRELFSSLEKLLGQEVGAENKWKETILELSNVWQGFSDITVNLWRGLQDDPMEELTETWENMKDISIPLSSAIQAVGGDFELLQALFPQQTQDAYDLATAMDAIGEYSLVSAIAMLHFADYLNMPLDNISTIDNLMESISIKLGEGIVVPFGTVTDYTGNLLDDTDSLAEVMAQLKDIMEDMYNVLLSIQTTSAAIESGGFEKWAKKGNDVTKMFHDWIDAQHILEGTEFTVDTWLETEATEEDIDGFVEYLFDTLPQTMATQYVMDFGETYTEMGIFQGNYMGLLDWLNSHGLTAAMSYLVQSDQFKETYKDDFATLNAELKNREFPVDFYISLNNLPWADAIVAEGESFAAAVARWEATTTIGIEFEYQKPKPKDLGIFQHLVNFENWLRGLFSAKGMVAGLQHGIKETRGITPAIIGEAGAEAVVPLVGQNRKFGKQILEYIIPRYFPDLMMQEGGIIDAETTARAGGKTVNVKVTINAEQLNNSMQMFDTILNEFKDGMITAQEDLNNNFITLMDTFDITLTDVISAFHREVTDLTVVFGQKVDEAGLSLYYLLKLGGDNIYNAANAIYAAATSLSSSTRSYYQRGGIVSSPTVGVFGEAGAEALIPLEGRNRKFGMEMIQAIIPQYYPELMHQTGGVFNTRNVSYGGGDSYSESFSVMGPVYVNATASADDFANQIKYRARTISKPR